MPSALRSSPPPWLAFLAVAIGALALLASLPALGEESLVVGFVQPTASEFLQRGALAALLVGIAVRFARLWPRLADGSRFAKLGTAAACIVFGLLLGWWGVAPAVAPGLAGALVGGFGAGGLAFFGAAVLGSKGRLEGGTEALASGGFVAAYPPPQRAPLAPNPPKGGTGATSPAPVRVVNTADSPRPPPVVVQPPYLPPPTGEKCKRCGEDVLNHRDLGLVCRSGHRPHCACGWHDERECPDLMRLRKARKVVGS